MRHLSLIVITLATLSFPRSSSPQVPGSQTAVRTQVIEVVRKFVDAFNSGDAGAVGDMYTSQPGVTSVGDGEIVRGWDRIRERYGQLEQAQGKVTLRIGSVDVSPLGQGYAFAVTTYTLAVGAQGNEIRENGALTLIVQNTAPREWKIIHDHTSSKAQRTQGASATEQQVPVTQPANPSAEEPTTIPIADGKAEVVAAANSIHYTVRLPGTACAVTGRIEGVSGGNKDFEAFLLDDDNFRNWSAELQAQAQWKSGRVTVTSINARVPGGTYHLVISNKFSVSTDKTVQPWAHAECR